MRAAARSAIQILRHEAVAYVMRVDAVPFATSSNTAFHHQTLAPELQLGETRCARRKITAY
jgi:hypothetical protein